MANNAKIGIGLSFPFLLFHFLRVNDFQTQISFKFLPKQTTRKSIESYSFYFKRRYEEEMKPNQCFIPFEEIQVHKNKHLHCNKQQYYKNKCAHDVVFVDKCTLDFQFHCYAPGVLIAHNKSTWIIRAMNYSIKSSRNHLLVHLIYQVNPTAIAAATSITNTTTSVLLLLLLLFFFLVLFISFAFWLFSSFQRLLNMCIHILFVIKVNIVCSVCCLSVCSDAFVLSTLLLHFIVVIVPKKIGFTWKKYLRTNCLQFNGKIQCILYANCLR